MVGTPRGRLPTHASMYAELAPAVAPQEQRMAPSLPHVSELNLRQAPLSSGGGDAGLAGMMPSRMLSSNPESLASQPHKPESEEVRPAWQPRAPLRPRHGFWGTTAGSMRHRAGRAAQGRAWLLHCVRSATRAIGRPCCLGCKHQHPS
jgi:hypothetical protein